MTTTSAQPRFELLETLLWRPVKGFSFLEEHLTRLQSSSQHFGYIFHRKHVESALELALSTATTPQRVRLTLTDNGTAAAQSQPLTSLLGRRVAIDSRPRNTDSEWVRHKTTNRSLYAEVMAQMKDSDDAILWNEAEEVTESCMANIVISDQGRLITPSAESGLLRGVFREYLLELGTIQERRLTVDQLTSCAEIWLINSVRGWLHLSADNGSGYWTITEELGLSACPSRIQHHSS